ncbi:hypothetical protein, partial [Parabacteroides sp. AM08-6]|uniref:hypothetical protein n=3 Tax=Parabacteroides sp. AM08-6 TaxID=2292053 RepID=UPI000FF5C393
TENYFDLRKPLLEGQSIPAPGDVVFRMGNKYDLMRQGVIYLATAETDGTYIDVLDKINSADMTGKSVVRIGNVSGITSKYKGNLGQAGIYHGIYIKGGIFDECDIYLPNGDTVYQSFQVLNGKLESEISSVRDAINDNGNNILANPTWDGNLDKWTYSQDIELLSAANGWLWFNAAFYSDKKKSAEVLVENGIRILRIFNSGITQANADLLNRDAGTYVIRVRYKAITAGTFSFGFSGKDLYKSMILTAMTDYQEETIIADWDGSGDFTCTYTGDIRIKSITVISDKIAAIRNEYYTKFLQTDQAIDLLAGRVTTNENNIVRAESKFSVTADWISGLVSRVTLVEGRATSLEEAGFVTNAQGNSLWANKTLFDNLSRAVDLQSAKFDVNASWISGLVSRVTTAENGIKSLNSAGFITQAQGNAWWVTSSDYTGNSIVNKINQTATSTKIIASKVEFYAYNLNMLRNSGNITKTTYWKVTGASSLDVSNGAIMLNLNITDASDYWGDIRNYSLAGVRLSSAKKYTVSFRISSTVSQQISIMIGPDSNGLTKNISIPAGTSNNKFTFQGKDVDAAFFRL